MRNRFVMIATLGLLCFAVGCNPNAERDRLVAEGQRKQVEHEQKMAALKAEQKQKRAEFEAEMKRLDNKRLESEIKLRLSKLSFAYMQAKQKLGRSPQGAEDLKPHLKSEDDLKSPRDEQLFDVAWGTEVGLGATPLIWERTAAADGGRWVRPPGPGMEARYVSEQELQTLRTAPPVGPGVQPPLQLPPNTAPLPPPVVIISPDPKTGPAGGTDPGKQAPLPK